MNKKWVGNEQEVYRKGKNAVSRGIKNIVNKNQPQKSWTTLFTIPFINHFREWAHFIYFPFTDCYWTWKKVQSLAFLFIPYLQPKS